MKVLDKIALILFSFIMLIISIIGSLVIFGWLDLTTIYMIASKSLSDSNISNILIGLNIVFILLSIKAIFFNSNYKNKEKYNDGILLENEDGKLLITKETLVSMVNLVVSGFDSVRNSQTRIMLDNEDNLSIIITIEADAGTIIKELSNNLQIRIKETIKKSLDLEVTNIDIRVKNVVDSKTEITKE